MSYYYIVDMGVDVPQIQGSRDSFDGTKKLIKLTEEGPSLGEVLTRNEARWATSTEFWNGPHPDA